MAKKRKPRGQQAIAVQPQVRSTTTWKPSDLRNVLYSADGGELRRLAELCEWVLGDERVATAYETRVGSLLGADLSFEEARPLGRKSQRDRRTGKVRQTRRSDIVRALDDDGDFWTIWPEDESRQIHTWARLMGVCPVHLEQPDEPDENGRLVPTARFWHPRALRQDPRTQRWFVKTGAQGETEVEIEPGSTEWMLFMPSGRVRPWANAHWRGISRWVLLKVCAEDDWGRAGEKAARSVVTGEKTNKDTRKELAAQIRDMGREGVIILPDGFDLKSIELAASTHELYERQINLANTSIDIAVQGQNLTTEVKQGSRAAATVHGDVAQKRLESDAESESTFLHEGPLAVYAQDNFGAADKAPWTVRDTEPEEDVAAKATTTKTMAEAIALLEDRGIEVDLDEVRDGFGLPITGVRKIVPKPTPAAAPPGQNPAQGEEKPPGNPSSPDDAAPPAPGAKALGSGDPPRAASGFVEGQSYADSLADRGIQRGGEALKPFLDSLRDRIDSITDLESARRLVLDFFKGAAAPEDVAELSEKVFLLASLGGALAVRQDAPEIEA